jgi:ribosomal protein S18 acetylase RimI-like enzyme
VTASEQQPHPPGRPHAGTADLRGMEACLATSWNRARPFVNTTPGDLEWWVASSQPGEDWSRRIRVWTDGGEVVAYAWFNPPGELDWHQRAGTPPSARAALVDDALAWLAATSRERARVGGMEPPPTLQTWAMDADAELVSLLTSRGWTAAPEPGYTHWYQPLDAGGGADPEPALPAGYRVRHVLLPDDVEERVDVHRAAFAPSRMTAEKYGALATMPLYAPEHDLVVEAPDGSLAAFVLVWWVPEARMGEFEPVGTHPAHQRLGLARAVNLAGLRLLRALGARDALVFSRTSNAASEALYESVGFRAVTHHRAWTRSL